MTIKYTLPSGKASFEGRTDGFGEKEFCFPASSKERDECLKEALIELAKLKETKHLIQ